MPKKPSKRRKRSARGKEPPAARRLRKLIETQREAFIAKFGREPRLSDPLFFESEAKVPTPIANPEEEVLQAMAKADIPPEFAYAVRKTGLFGFGGDKSCGPSHALPSGMLPSKSIAPCSAH